MANDVYVKFGEYDGTGGPLDTRLPDIEGDSTDSVHFYWCELRECGFDLETPEQSADGDDGGDGGSSQSSEKKPAATFKPVKLRKRVDWASTTLFRKCCEAAMATTAKSTEDKGQGRIDVVTVEVCRPVSGTYYYPVEATEVSGVGDDQQITERVVKSVISAKMPCAVVKYIGVRIIKYEISITGPEPAESITFEFDSMGHRYMRSDPRTNEAINDRTQRTTWLKNHHPAPRASTSNVSGGGNDSSPASGGSANPGAGGGSPSPAAPPPPGGASGAPGSAPDSTVTVNFPGLWQGTGFGLLPD